jgi:hypothetical protein
MHEYGVARQAACALLLRRIVNEARLTGLVLPLQREHQRLDGAQQRDAEGDLTGGQMRM